MPCAWPALGQAAAVAASCWSLHRIGQPHLTSYTLPRPCGSVLSDTGLGGTLPGSWACGDQPNCSLPLLESLWLVGPLDLHWRKGHA